MRADRIAELLQFAVDRLLAERRIEGKRIEKKVDVFRESLDQIPAFGQARPAFEDHLIAGRGGDDPKGLGNVIVLLDDRRAQPAALEVFRRTEHRLVEVGMFKQSHVCGFPWPASCERKLILPAFQSQTGKAGSRMRAVVGGSWRVCRAARRLRRALPALAAVRSARLSADGRRSPFSCMRASVRLTVILRRQFARLGLIPQEVEQGTVAFGKVGPGRRPTGVDHRIGSNELSRQAQASRGNLAPFRILCGETQEPGGGYSGREESRSLAGKLSDRGRIGPALSEGGLPGTVINALAQPLDGSSSRESRQRLGDGRKG